MRYLCKNCGNELIYRDKIDLCDKCTEAELEKTMVEINTDNQDMYKVHKDPPPVRRKKKKVNAKLVWVVGGKVHQVIDQGSWALMQDRKKREKHLYTVGGLEVIGL